MIVDLHVHLNLEKDDEGSSGAAVGKLLDCMDRVGVRKANIIPMVVKNGGHLDFLNERSTLFCAEFLNKAVNKHKNRLFSMIWLNPYLETGFLRDIIRKYVIGGYINGVKLLTEMNASDKRLEPLAALLEEYDIPLLYHCWYKTVGKGYSESDPSEISRLAGKFPGLRIVMAHLGGCRCRGVQEIKKHKNVLIDTSGSFYEDGYLEYALKELGPDRVLFGSDYPGRDMAAQMSRIYSVEMKPEDRRKLLGINAVNFLSFPGGKRYD